MHHANDHRNAIVKELSDWILTDKAVLRREETSPGADVDASDALMRDLRIRIEKLREIRSAVEDL